MVNLRRSTSISTDAFLWCLYVAGKSYLSWANTSVCTFHSLSAFFIIWSRVAVLWREYTADLFDAFLSIKRSPALTNAKSKNEMIYNIQLQNNDLRNTCWIRIRCANCNKTYLIHDCALYRMVDSLSQYQIFRKTDCTPFD